MRVGVLNQRKVVNYGRVVAVIPLSLGGIAAPISQAAHFGVAPYRATPTAPKTAVSSELGQRLEVEWASYTSEFISTLERITLFQAAQVDFESWFETSFDAVYPEGPIIDVLELDIVEDSRAEPFRFTDTDFDAWV